MPQTLVLTRQIGDVRKSLVLAVSCSKVKALFSDDFGACTALLLNAHDRQYGTCIKGDLNCPLAAGPMNDPADMALRAERPPDAMR